MNAWDIVALVFTSMGVGALLDIAYAKWMDRWDRREHVRQPGSMIPEKCAPPTAADHPKPPHVPSMTATWPARWVEVNGFRYVLDEKEQTPTDAQMIDWLADEYCPGEYRPDPVLTAITHGNPTDLRATIRTAMQQKDPCNRCGKPKGSAEGCCSC